MLRTLYTRLRLSPPVSPAAAITHRWAPVVCVPRLKGDVVEGEQAGRHLALERFDSSCPCSSHCFIASCNNFVPLPL
jgi:hypothetical protein